MSHLIERTTPLRVFQHYEGTVCAVVALPDKRRIVTASEDKTLRLWDLKTGAVLKKMQGHSNGVWALAVSRDGQTIASGDYGGEVIYWHGKTGKSLTQPIKVHTSYILSLDFSPDGTVLATSSSNSDRTVKFWYTKTWQMQREPIQCDANVLCVRYSPSGELLAIATADYIQIYNPDAWEHVASFKGHNSYNLSLAWTPDGTRLLSAGNQTDPTIREWDSLTWQEVGHPCEGHTNDIFDIAIHPAGTLAASASSDNHVRLWRLSDRRTIAIFQHSSAQTCITFSVDGKHIFSGSIDHMISEWEIPKNVVSKILAITAARHACLTGDLSTAEELLTRERNLFYGIHQIYVSRPQQRHGCLKGLRLAAATTLETHLQHLFARPPHHAMLPMFNPPFGRGLQFIVRWAEALWWTLHM